MRRTRIALAIAAVFAGVLPAVPAQAAPAIRFLNPSNYSASMVMSDEQDRDTAYHIVAWVKEVPGSPLVEFELASTTPGSTGATIAATRVGNDTWEAFYPISTGFQDGAYDLTARLYSGQPGNASEITNTTIRVTINRDPVPPPPEARTVEMTYPDNGDPVGFVTPKGAFPNAVLDFTASAGAQQVRALFTRSDPGNVTEWVQCGTAEVPEGLGGKVRCTLTEGVNPLDVNALAVVANNTTWPAPANPALDESGDAHRVLPYAQVPTTIEVSPESTTTAPAACKLLTARVLDQQSRPIAGINVDIHAVGPDDQISFGSIVDQTNAFKEPESNHVAAREPAIRCDNKQDAGWQGDHNVPLEDDLKHIESISTGTTPGTLDNGTFAFALMSEITGGTNVIVWADVNDDDLQGQTEAYGAAQLGWGTAPPDPITDITLTPVQASGTPGSCVAFEVLLRRGGSPFSGANVDVHLTGPDSNVNFCDVSGGTTRRDPDGGEHTTGTHTTTGTRHTEGETASTGKFVFGVFSPVQGQTDVLVWYDKTEDDVLSGELQKAATVTWAPAGDRSITLASSRSSVAKGRRVRLSGQIQGDPSCAGTQLVRLESKPRRGGSFQTVKTLTTDSQGAYTTRVRMNSTKRFRTVAPAAEPCEEAISNTVTVRAR